jgi:hypothetical protein
MPVNNDEKPTVINYQLSDDSLELEIW